MKLQIIRTETPIIDLVNIIILTATGILDIARIIPSYIEGMILLLVALWSIFAYERFYGTLITIKAVFSTLWLLSIGLSLLRLHPLQEAWSISTWSVIIIGYFALMCGLFVQSKFNVKKSKSAYRQEQILELTLFLGIIISLCFMLDCIYSRQLPILSSNMSSYMDFGMPLVHYVTVFGCLYPCIAYIVLKQFRCVIAKQKILARLIKIFAVIVTLIPVLSVSRMQLLIETFALAIAWYLFGWREKKIKKKYLIGFCCLAILLWIVLSQFRNQDYLYISQVFQLQLNSNIQSALWQIYLYLSFNFDNLNVLIGNFTDFSHGELVTTGLQSIFGLDDNLNTVIGNTNNYRILNTFNTYTMLKDPYMDFGVVGIFPYMFFLGIVSGFIERKARYSCSFIYISIYVLFLYGFAMCFFTDVFSGRMLMANILILIAIGFVVQFDGKHVFKRF